MREVSTGARGDAAQRLLRQNAKLEDKIKMLREALKPFVQKIHAPSMSEALGSITREQLEAAKDALEDTS